MLSKNIKGFYYGEFTSFNSLFTSTKIAPLAPVFSARQSAGRIMPLPRQIFGSGFYILHHEKFFSQLSKLSANINLV
jgi:hypothetical protein